MIQNKIYHVSVDDVIKIVQEAKNSDNSHIVEISGAEIQSWEDYICKIEEAFSFPTPWTRTIDSYDDWMRDLDWLGKDSYILVIHDYKNFLGQDLSLKKTIMEGFSDLILPWWQNEVEICAVGDKAKPFNIYLVD